MKIGVFSGSFNPIHIGHLILANYIVEYSELDEVWFVVTPHSPFKEENSLLDENERLKMVALATEPYEKLHASDFEFSLPRPSYTVDTLAALSEKHPEHEFTLIIGGDNWDVFPEWKDYESIIKNNKILVYPRLGSRISISPRYRNSVVALDSPLIEISSTFIRKSIVENKNIRPYLPVEIFEYIKKNNLYK